PGLFGGGAVPALRSASSAGPDGETVVTLVEPPAHPVARPAGEAREEGGRPSSGERRTVTIVCCALGPLDRAAGESGGLDLEVLSEVAMAFESLGREVCRELDGSLGAVFHRMLWLCFGYPQ